MSIDLFLRAKKFVVSLRLSILTIFIIFFVVTILFLMALTYFRASNTILFTANKLMQQTSSRFIEEMDDEMLDAEDEAQFVAQLIQKNILNINDQELFAAYLFGLIKRYPIVQSAFWGDEQGNFFIAEKEFDGRLILRVVSQSQGHSIHKVTIYRKEYNQDILQQTISKDFFYDPRERSWYQMAKKAGRSIWTDVYAYEPSKLLGMTVSIPVFNKNKKFRGVFAFDIRLDFLSRFVAAETAGKNGLAFISTMNGRIIAFPQLEKLQFKDKLVDIHDLKIPWLMRSFNIYKKKLANEFTFKYGNQTYLANYNHIPHFSELGWIMGIVVPEDDFIFDLKQGIMIDMSLGVLILVLGIIFVSSIITRVVNPIKKVVTQIDKIKHFDLSPQQVIQSRIEEVILLSDAVGALRSGLQSFQKYVPASLVRQLIETGENARIGGTKKTLTIFFSDVENFTTLAENMDPNLLMEYTCEYFDAISKIILEEQGTIDKYIGDSVMAFWGAPLAVENPCQKAARAALRCLRRLDELNEEWEAARRSRFITRVGLHMGDVIVGNVGSSERMNYTALGDAINVASRLEGLNKIYFTRIVVSEMIYEAIRDQFVLRMVDCVAVKGKIASGNVYELLAENPSELSFDIDRYRHEFAKSFLDYQHAQWNEAIAGFEICLKIYPGDSVAPIFIRRCREFKLNPPQNWDGVWRLSG